MNRLYLVFVYLFISSVAKVHARAEYDEFLPQKTDLIPYLKSLHRVVSFFQTNKLDLDINLEFGVFVLGVNLKAMFHKRGYTLPYVYYIENILEENDRLIKFFNKMVVHDEKPEDRSSKLMASLFINETQWELSLPKFNMKLIEAHKLRSKSIFEDQVEYLTYSGSIYKYEDFVPTPNISDMCFTSLANNARPEKPLDTFPKADVLCPLDKPCYEALADGTDFGYAITHRTLLLITAKYARSCSIFSSKRDKEIIDTLCQNIYEEAKFLAAHEYELMDLFLEQITTCALNGHAEFLRRDWIEEALTYQSQYGCFGQRKQNSEEEANIPPVSTTKKWVLEKNTRHSLLGGRCDGHITSVASATLALAVRYIIESYY